MDSCQTHSALWHCKHTPVQPNRMLPVAGLHAPNTAWGMHKARGQLGSVLFSSGVPLGSGMPTCCPVPALIGPGWCLLLL